MTGRIRTAVIGLGRVGSAYHRAPSPDAPPATHVEAIIGNGALELSAVCDSSTEQREHFRERWAHATPVHDSVGSLLAAGPYDIVTIATPTASHRAVLEQVLAAKPRAVFCEKPMCQNLGDAEAAARHAAEGGTAISVNYHRRWDRRLQRLRAELAAAGAPCHAEFTYMKGLYNYGAHAVDLLQFLLGPICGVEGARGGAAPRAAAASNPSATLLLANGARARLAGVDGTDYEIFDLDIYFPDRKYRLEFGGQRIVESLPVAGRFLEGYTNLGPEQPWAPDAPIHGLRYAYEELAAWVRDGRPPETSTAANALSVHRVLAAIEKSAATAGGPEEP